MPDHSPFLQHIVDIFRAAGRVIDSDVMAELAQHAEATYESARADGATREEATRHVHALIAAWCAGSTGLQRRPKRDPMVVPPASHNSRLAGIGQDVMYGLRLLRHQRAFSLVAILTIALGTSATTVLFSVAYGVLIKPLPWAESDRLVRVSESRQGHEPRIRGTITNATYLAWRTQPTTIEEIGGWRLVPSTVVIDGGEPTRLQIAAITPSLFTVLKAQPLRGRLFFEDDRSPIGNLTSEDVIVLSHGLWQERYGGRDDAIGRVMRVSDKPLLIVGVMPRDFVFPDRETRAWMPGPVPAVVGEQGVRRVTIFSALARLRSGVTPAQAAAEGTSRARSAPDPGLAAVAMFGGSGPAEIAAVPAVEMMTADVRPALMVIFAAVMLLFVTATANVASLQLSRAVVRRREMAIRAAIGAGTARLTRQLVIESLLIGVAGGLAGLALAIALNRALPSILPADFPRLHDVTIDAHVMMFSVAVSLAAGVACSLLPAWHTRRLNLTESLSENATTGGGGFMRSPVLRARAAIMVAQVAVACVLLIGAALLTRSFVALINSDRGYDPRNLLTARLPLSAGMTLEQRTELLNTLAARLRAIPGVSDVAFGNALPLLTTGGFRAFKMRAATDPSVEVDVNAIQRVVSPGYFNALGLRLAAGRTFTDQDTMSARPVIAVNESFAARYLGMRPIGAIVPNLGMCRGNADRWEVVGIVKDMRQGAVVDARQPEIFMPYAQVGCAAAVTEPIIVVKTIDDPLRYATLLRSVARQEAPTLALDSVMTMEDRVMNTLAKPRLYAVVLAGFGGFALAIAAVGLFAVISSSVAQRAREIGVRTALGARPADIVALVLRQLAVISICGIATGVGLALVLSRSLSTVLYGVNTHDPTTFVVVPVILVLMSSVACAIPARRAAHIDPVRTLRAG